ncbi:MULTISPECIES: nucleotidyltransferase family protein [Comamonas]|uniref:nucleotidyltransferase family protein n=1 Tax=Comamonas TaxID=283 RepID=UPI0015F7AFCA|nr:nucleotidyltransferase family protein [Comamonas koreensis]
MSHHIQNELETRLVALVRSSSELMAALGAVRALGLSSWCIGAGAVRSLVWDSLHGYKRPSDLADVDVVYFDDSASAKGQDAELELRLASIIPSVRWEVTNQATVHHWFAEQLGIKVPAIRSLEEGISTWPEFATCVGVNLDEEDAIGIVAPHGLYDLFGLVVRHNPLRVSVATYQQRIQSKRFGERWPLLSIEGC